MFNFLQGIFMATSDEKKYRLTHRATPYCYQALCGKRTALQSKCHSVWLDELNQIGASIISQSVKNDQVIIWFQGGSVESLKWIYLSPESKFSKILKSSYQINWSEYDVIITEEIECEDRLRTITRLLQTA